MSQSVNLELLEQIRQLTEDLIQNLMYLKFQVPFNSDERVAIEDAIRNTKVLSLTLDGTFFRAEEVGVTIRAPIAAPGDDDIIIFPSVMPVATRKKAVNG